MPGQGPGRGMTDLNWVGGGQELDPAVLDVAERLGRGQEGLQRREQLCWGGFLGIVPRVGDLHGPRVGNRTVCRAYTTALACRGSSAGGVAGQVSSPPSNSARCSAMVERPQCRSSNSTEAV